METPISPEQPQRPSLLRKIFNRISPQSKAQIIPQAQQKAMSLPKEENPPISQPEIKDVKTETPKTPMSEVLPTDKLSLLEIRQKLDSVGENIRIDQLESSLPPDIRTSLQDTNIAIKKAADRDYNYETQSSRKPHLIATLKDARWAYSAGSQRVDVNVFGALAEASPEYRQTVRSILKQRFPSGQIVVYRGGTAAQLANLSALDRQFINVTSDRSIAKEFDWHAPLKDPLDLDGILVPIIDIVAIGNIGQSEYVLRSDALRQAAVKTSAQAVT